MIFSARLVEVNRGSITENTVQTNGYCVLHVERPQGKVGVIAATSEWLCKETSSIIPPYRILVDSNNFHIVLTNPSQRRWRVQNTDLIVAFRLMESYQDRLLCCSLNAILEWYPYKMKLRCTYQ